MKKLILFLICITTNISAVDDDKLQSYCQNKIDQASYYHTHQNDTKYPKLYCEGYIDAMNHVLYMLNSGNLD